MHRQWNGQSWESYEEKNPNLTCDANCAGCADDDHVDDTRKGKPKRRSEE